MSYNMSFADSVNNFGDLLPAVNTLSNGLVITVFLMLFWFIGLIVFSRNNDFKNVFIVDNFILLVTTLICWSIGLVAYFIMIIPIILLVASIVLKFVSKSD